MKTSIDLLLQKASNLAREKETKMCGSKIKYASKEDADKAKLSVEVRRGWAMNSYQCPFCHNYHIGHAS